MACGALLDLPGLLLSDGDGSAGVLLVLEMLVVLDRSFGLDNYSLNDLCTHIPNTVLWPSDICVKCGRAFDSFCILPAEGDTGIDV